MKTPPQTDNAVADLLAVARDLRDKNGGCPWDLEQTHASLAKHLLEESSELIEVIEKGISPETDAAFKEELGDVLFQVVIHAQLAGEEGRFNFSDVARGVADKLISRHPHVYADATAKTSDQVLKNWEAIKARERQKKQARTSYLDGVPKILPALQRAERLGEKASRIGFDWPEGPAGTKMIREKISEELAELDEVTGVDQERAGSALPGPAVSAVEPMASERAEQHDVAGSALPGMASERAEQHDVAGSALPGMASERAREELGDLLFSIAQYGRRLGIDSEGALRAACAKFDRRFRSMEIAAAAGIADGRQLSAAEWDKLWNKAKQAV